MKIQILWAPPAERRFGSGDILTAEQCAELGLDPVQLVEAYEAQVIEPAKTERTTRPAAKVEKRKGGHDRGGECCGTGPDQRRLTK